MAALMAQRLGLNASQAELQCSLVPTDYKYPQPSPAQLARLMKQCSAPQAQPAAGPRAQAGVGGPAALQGAPLPAVSAAPAGAAKPASHLPPGVEDMFTNQLALELDEDCLRILLGEDESGPCASNAASGKGAAKGSSEKSSATDHEAEAGSLDDDDIAMLFGETRHTGGSSLEAMDLHLLGTAALTATDDSDTGSQADGNGGATTAAAATAHHSSGCEDGEVLMAAAEAGTGLKRSKSCCAGDGAFSPPGRGLMLSMNYEQAAQSINLELLAGGCKSSSHPCSDGVDSMLPFLSPIMAFASIDSPDSPNSLASGCHAMSPETTFQRQDSSSKRKRAVCQ